jgi:WD40 repeat protein
MVSKAIKGMSTTLFVDDLEKLSTFQCEQLQCGDLVVLSNDEEKFNYVVASKQFRDYLILVHVDGDYIVSCEYDFNVDKWEYAGRKATPILTGDKVSKVWNTSDELDGLGSNLLSQVKVGDIVCSSSTGAVGVVAVKDDETIILSILGFDMFITNYYYAYDIDNGWEYNETVEFDGQSIPTNYLHNDSSNKGKFLQVQEDGSVAPATVSGGTKLYKHAIECEDSDGNTFDIKLIAPFSSTLSFSEIHLFYNDGGVGVIEDFDVEQEVGTIMQVQQPTASYTRVLYYSAANGEIKFVDLVQINSDVVTAV